MITQEEYDALAAAQEASRPELPAKPEMNGTQPDSNSIAPGDTTNS